MDAPNLCRCRVSVKAETLCLKSWDFLLFPEQQDPTLCTQCVIMSLLPWNNQQCILSDFDFEGLLRRMKIILVIMHKIRHLS